MISCFYIGLFLLESSRSKDATHKPKAELKRQVGVKNMREEVEAES